MSKCADLDLELLYFDIAGKAEPLRLAAAYADVALTDTRFGSRDEFEAKKAAGELAFGQVPALRVGSRGNLLLVQSNAILRYIARLAPESGLYPADDAVLAAQVDALLDQEADLRQGLTCSIYQERFGFGSLGGQGTDATNAVRAALNGDVLPRHLGNFERIAAASGTGWLVGTAGPTIADFVVALSVEGLASGKIDGISAEILAPYPALLALIAKVKALPSTVAWYAAKA
jgi:glutathione S-transferase